MMRARTILSIAAVAVVACADQQVDPVAPPVHDEVLAAQSTSLLTCPSGDATTAEGLASPVTGLVLEAGGFTVEVPPEALWSETWLKLTVVAGPYVEVEVSAAGHEHFQFAAPIDITLSYARCERDFATPLRAGYIDSETKQVLEVMGGTDDKSARKVRFKTDHLSGYGVLD